VSRTNLAPPAARNNRQPLPASFADLSGVHCGWDRVQVWFRKPLAADEYRKVADAGCADIITFNERARFEPRYIRRNVFTVPSDDALAVLRDLRDPDDYLLNIAEPGLSINFHEDRPKVASFWYMAKTSIQPYHRGEHGVRFVGQGETVTRYSGPAYGRNVDGLYADRPCRFTGEIECLHPDRRISGADACRAAGIETFQDMIDFDHVGFWRRNLRLFEIDARRLGRMQLNKERGQRRRLPLEYRRGRFSYDLDLRVGTTLIRAAGRTNQEAVDRYRGILPVRRALISVDVEPILRQLALD
jgi:hypothetical protein